MFLSLTQPVVSRAADQMWTQTSENGAGGLHQCCSWELHHSLMSLLSLQGSRLKDGGDEELLLTPDPVMPSAQCFTSLPKKHKSAFFRGA